MVGQIQVIPDDKPYEGISKKILDKKDELFKIANSTARSSKVKEIEVRAVQDESQVGVGTMLIVELIINTHDAMGANIVNTMCEAVGPAIESITGCRTI